MIYAIALELGVWDAHFVNLSFVGSYRSSLEPSASCILYNETPVPIQILTIADLYIDLLWTIKKSEGKDSLHFFPNNNSISPKMISKMAEEIRSEPLPTTKYVSWAFEKASHNLEAQNEWPL